MGSTLIMVIVFLGWIIITFSQTIKINRILWKYFSDFWGTGSLTNAEKTTITKSCLTSIVSTIVLIGILLLIFGLPKFYNADKEGPTKEKRSSYSLTTPFLTAHKAMPTTFFAFTFLSISNL